MRPSLADRVDPIAAACSLHDRAERDLAAGNAVAARDAAARAAAIFWRVDGPRSGDLANSLLLVALAQEKLARLDDALANARQARAIVARLRDRSVEMDRLRANTLCVLAAIYIARGEYTLARRVFVRAVAIAARLGPRDHAAALNGLGMTCKFTGRYAEGERVYRQALAIARRASGRCSVEVADILHNLGGLDHARGAFASGVRWQRLGLAIREQLLGRDHVDVAADLAALVALLDGVGRADEARRLYHRALAIYKRAYGPRHFEVGFNLGNLAALELACGRRAVAARLFPRAIAIQERVLGSNHPFVATARANFGKVRQLRSNANMK
jgi:tetratricopeptide (TPR) repeat protein